MNKGGLCMTAVLLAVTAVAVGAAEMGTPNMPPVQAWQGPVIGQVDVRFYAGGDDPLIALGLKGEAGEGRDCTLWYTH